MKQFRLLTLLVLLMTAATGAWAQDTYKVSMKSGVKDATNWTITPTEATTTGVAENTEVTLQYNGRLKVKGVKATSDAKPVWDGDLSKLTAESTAEFATATDGMTIKGALAEGVNVKVSIAAGATVTLDGVTINGVNNDSYLWAGINCLGDATIILSGTNTVKGFHENYPGIHVPVDKTLTIQGSGSLTASSNGYGCGIGAGRNIAACGNIVIAGGTVNATGGDYAAGIGGGRLQGSCGNISITGGTINANGGAGAAGIGSGNNGSCGTVTITDGVTSVTATKGADAPYSIGKGFGSNASCGTVTIGGTKYWENNAAVDDAAATYLALATIVYPPVPATVTTAPTGAAIVGVGMTTALVSGGVADGGTLMYAVTTTNTKPTSTEGFSATVPTAQTITASGKVYVWYFVKADDTHTDSEIAATAIEVPVADIVWDVTNVSDLRVMGTFMSYTKEGVTLSANAEQIEARWRDFEDPERDGIEFEVMEPGGLTFTAPTGKAFTKIEMKPQGPEGWDFANLGTGWTLVEKHMICTVTWTGSAASTVGLLPDNFFGAKSISCIAFYLSE